MENLSVEDATKKIEIYLKQSTSRPYFVICEDSAELKKLTKNFSELEQIYLSYFSKGDYLPSTDIFIDSLLNLQNDAICFGVGEYVYFTGKENFIRKLQDKSFGRKIIFVCRRIAKFLESLADEDIKFRANNICKVGDAENLQVTKYNKNLDIDVDAENFSQLLKLSEVGKLKNITVKTDLPLKNVKNINSYFDAVKDKNSRFNISESALTSEQWQEYFFNDNCENYPPEHWRTFAAGFKKQFAGNYLRRVFEKSATYDDYRKNLVFAILDFEVDKVFFDFYFERKEIIKNIFVDYAEEYFATLAEKAKNSDATFDALNYLTDNTILERQEIVKYLQGRKKIPEVLEKIYPQAANYFSDFDIGDKEITDYFRRYKKIKVFNLDDEEFKTTVEKIALERPYNKLQKRGAILETADKNAKLYWLDALGAEFAGYIKAKATVEKLSVNIKIACADLPTLTSQNKYFFDNWQGKKFSKNQKLDDLKHSAEKITAPIYFCNELAIIDEVISEIKTALKNSDCDKVILTSDHGASRLAVTFGRDSKFKLNSVGEHSGRCCLKNEIDEKPDFATEENGYWVSANYSRFQGGRLSSCEVHGGATLEEILVPVAEFTLQKKVVLQKDLPKVEAESKKTSPTEKIDDGFDFFE